MHAPSLGLVDCAGVREHLIPRAREPRPIVSSRGAAGGVTEEGNRRDFLGQEFFFFYNAHLAHETYHPDGFSAALPGEARDDFRSDLRMTKLWRFKYFTFCRREFYSLGLNYGLDELFVI